MMDKIIAAIALLGAGVFFAGSCLLKYEADKRKRRLHERTKKSLTRKQKLVK